MVKSFEEFLANIDDAEKREKLREILSKIKENFPELNEEIRWNQPMFTDHETFIIALSVAKAHMQLRLNGSNRAFQQRDRKGRVLTHKGNISNQMV